MKMMAVFLLTLGGMALIMVIMAVGVIFSGRCLRGSGGGGEAVGPAGEPLSCATCPHRNREEVTSSV